MSSIILATTCEEVRQATLLPLAREGLPVASAADWDGLCRAVCTPTTALLLVDPTLPGLRPELLVTLAASVAHRPLVRVLGGPLPPLIRVAPTERSLLRLARLHAGAHAIGTAERRMLRLQGIGNAALERLAQLAASALPVLIHGERGTGKERIARVLHRLSGLTGPFVTLGPTAAWAPSGPPGTVYLESAQRRDDPRAIVALARDAEWRIIGGTRLAESVPTIKWERLAIAPLRERPADLRELATGWLDEHSRRMGLPKRSFDRGMWALLLAHRWPGNHRELEMFVVHTLGRVDRPLIRGSALPDEVRALLLPGAEAEREAEGFEEMARVRLLPVVSAYAPGGGQSLHGLVVASAERALIQLVLARTQGNRKAAATLLGLARNTLQSRIQVLGIDKD